MITHQPLQPVEVERGVVFGSAPVGHGGSRPGPRPLTLDVYRPAAPADGLRPALLLSHGGAYHRGAKEEDLFEQDGWYNTPVAEYCRRFAARGFVCFSVGYRLAQEGVPPQAEPIKRERQLPPGSRMARLSHTGSVTVHVLVGLKPPHGARSNCAIGAPFTSLTKKAAV